MKKKDVLNMSDKNLSDKVRTRVYFSTIDEFVLKRLSVSEIQNKDILEDRSLNLKCIIVFYMR